MKENFCSIRIAATMLSFVYCYEWVSVLYDVKIGVLWRNLYS